MLGTYKIFFKWKGRLTDIMQPQLPPFANTPENGDRPILGPDALVNRELGTE
jgi:hypothetical protein